MEIGKTLAVIGLSVANLVSTAIDKGCDAGARISSEACEAAKGIEVVSADLVKRLADRGAKGK